MERREVMMAEHVPGGIPPLVHEPVRLAALQRTLLLDSPADPAFDRLTRLAARLLHVPVALVALVNQERLCFKSAVGLPEPWASPREMPLSHSFWHHVVAAGEPVLVANASQEPLRCDNVAIPGLHVVAYAGIPLITADGHVLGSFCAIDSVPREWTADDVALLRELAAAAMAEVQARLRADEAERERHEQTAILESISDALFALDRDWRITYVNVEAERVLQRPRSALIGRCVWTEFPESIGSQFEQAYRRAVADQVTVGFETFYPPLDIWVDVRANPTPHGLSVFFRDITERKQAEAALRESHARREFVLEASKIGEWELDLSTGKTQQTLIHDQCFGALEPLQEWSYEIFLSYVHPDDRAEVQRRLDKAIQEHTVWNFQCRVVWPDASVHWIEVKGYFYRDAKEQPARMVGIVSDITEQKEVEAALRESEARFRLMADAVPESIWITDAVGRAEFLNKQWCDYCGVPYAPTTAAEIAASFLHPDDGPRVMAAFSEAMRTGRPFEIEQRNRSATGEYRWFLNRANPYVDPQTGTISNWFGVGIDIHARKLAEEAVRESEARFHAVADLVPDMLWSSDPRGSLEWINQRWSDYTRQGLAEAQGYGWLDAIHPDDRESSRRKVQTAFEGGAPLRQEQRMRGADGEYRWFLVQEQPLRDATGQVVRWYGAATDIHNERMALEVAQAAQAEAEAALTARDGFMSMLSHDLKQPLAVIQAYAGLAQRRLGRPDTHTPARIADSLGKIEAAANRMTQFIDELLDVARLRAGQPLDLEVGPTDLLVLVRRVVAEQQQTTERHRLQVTALLPELAGAYDATRLERVLVNLLSNAIKYSPEGGAITICVMEDADAAKRWAVIQVRDEGMGVPAADLPYIFERFRRGTNVIGQIGGSGIGLASAQQIIQQHGGTLMVESVEGKGSTFTIRLPLASRAGSEAPSLPPNA